MYLWDLKRMPLRSNGKKSVISGKHRLLGRKACGAEWCHGRVPALESDQKYERYSWGSCSAGYLPGCKVNFSICIEAHLTRMSVETRSPADHIQVIFLSIIYEIQKRPAGNPHITIRRIIPDRSNLSQQVREREVTYRWPGKNREEAWRFGNCFLPRQYSHDESRILTCKCSMRGKDPHRYARCSAEGVDDNKEVGNAGPCRDPGCNTASVETYTIEIPSFMASRH